MKTNSALDRIRVRSLPTGRRDHVARRTQEALLSIDPKLDAATAATIAARCAALFEHSCACGELERRYSAAQTKPVKVVAKATGQARAPRTRSPIDLIADRAVASLEDTAAAYIKGFDVDEPEHIAAVSFISQALPEGINYIIRASYPEQLQRMVTLIDYCRGDGEGLVTALCLEPWVGKIEGIIPRYAEMLQALPPSPVRYAQVQDAQREGHACLRRLVLAILDAFPNSSPDHEAARVHLLAPLVQQEDAVADLMRRQRAVHDIDPTTGEDLLSDAPDAPAD